MGDARADAYTGIVCETNGNDQRPTINDQRETGRRSRGSGSGSLEVDSFRLLILSAWNCRAIGIGIGMMISHLNQSRGERKERASQLLRQSPAHLMRNCKSVNAQKTGHCSESVRASKRERKRNPMDTNDVKGFVRLALISKTPRRKTRGSANLSLVALTLRHSVSGLCRTSSYRADRRTAQLGERGRTRPKKETNGRDKRHPLIANAWHTGKHGPDWVITGYSWLQAQAQGHLACCPSLKPTAQRLTAATSPTLPPYPPSRWLV